MKYRDFYKIFVSEAQKRQSAEKELEEALNQLASVEQQRNDAAEQLGKLRQLVNELEQTVTTYKEYKVKCEQMERAMDAKNSYSKNVNFIFSKKISL